MQIRLKTSMFVAVILLVILTGCGGGGGGAKTGKGEVLQSAPAELQTVYKNRCLSCHGAELEGRMGNVTNLQQVGSRLTRDQIAERIEVGKEPMPGFADKLTREEIDGLTDWLFSLK